MRTALGKLGPLGSKIGHYSQKYWLRCHLRISRPSVSIEL